MCRSIIEIREEMFMVALAEQDLRLLNWALDTFRQPAVKKARATASEMTVAIGDAVRAMCAEHPNWTNRMIGANFNIDGGRVSEAMAGWYSKERPHGPPSPAALRARARQAAVHEALGGNRGRV
jgi:hypothetical protein